MRSAIILISILSMTALSLQDALAQGNVSYACNSMRHGDALKRQKYLYVVAERKGRNVIWHLDDVNNNEKTVTQNFQARNDTTGIYEEGHIHHYVVGGDTLYYKGGQQRRAYRRLNCGRPVLAYPFNYGDSIAGPYSGYGRDENSDITIEGEGYTVADGTGIIASSTDTVYNVLRLHFHDDYTETYPGDLKINYLLDRCQWYSLGYRYPVMESYRLSVVDNGKETPVDSATYLCLPESQVELDDDPANASILAMLSDGSPDKPTQTGSVGSITEASANISSGSTILDIDYSLSSNSDVDFLGCDVTGNVLCHTHYSDKEAGTWHDSLALSRKPVGNVVVLRIQCGSETTTIKACQNQQ